MRISQRDSGELQQVYECFLWHICHAFLTQLIGQSRTSQLLWARGYGGVVVTPHLAAVAFQDHASTSGYVFCRAAGAAVARHIAATEVEMVTRFARIVLVVIAMMGFIGCGGEGGNETVDEPGTEQMPAARTVDLSGPWKGSWDSTTVSGLRGSFTATLAQTGNQLSGTVRFTFAFPDFVGCESRGTLSGSISGVSPIDDARSEISFMATLTLDGSQRVDLSGPVTLVDAPAGSFIDGAITYNAAETAAQCFAGRGRIFNLVRG